MPAPPTAEPPVAPVAASPPEPPAPDPPNRSPSSEPPQATSKHIIGQAAVLPAREALDEATKRYQAGEADLSLVLGARRELSSAQEKWTEASAEVRRADIDLWQHTGHPRRLDEGWSP